MCKPQVVWMIITSVGMAIMLGLLIFGAVLSL